MRSVYGRVVLALLLVGAITVTGCDTPENNFPSLTNNARAAAGKGPLSTEPPGRAFIYGLASENSKSMCLTGKLTNAIDSAGGFSAIGKNVGAGRWNQGDVNSWPGNTNSLFQAFMNSPGHRANILDNWNYQVVAQYVCPDGQIYVTHVFLRN